ncbi:hypothetical protein JCM10908_002188 [Rhodotorula pacifica]|uniref:uncharacterized protein n=1 Tax=Rhodotorula pacifica TaxID=1495444 RepID=UPI003177B12F
MPVHATPVSGADALAGSPPAASSRSTASNSTSSSGGPPRLRAVPSTRPGVADVPISPKAQEKFYEVHDAMLAIGARPVTGADDFERDLKREEQEQGELQELVDVQNGSQKVDGSSQPVRAIAGSSRSLPASQTSSSSRTSEREVERYLRPSTAATTQEKRSSPSKAGQPAFHLYGLDEAVELADDKIENPDSSPPPEAIGTRAEAGEVEDEGPPSEEEEEEEEHNHETEAEEEKNEDTEQATDERAEPVQPDVASQESERDSTAPDDLRTKASAATGPAEASEASRADEKAHSTEVTTQTDPVQQFFDFWQEHVSKINPPLVWYRQQAAPSTDDAPESARMTYGCKLTLVMPDSTQRTFETPATCADTDAARLRAVSDARASGVLDLARKLREEVGWEAEEQEAEQEREKVRRLKGGEKPWEMLVGDQSKWMAPPIKAKLEKDELNAVYGCTLTIQTSLSSAPLTFCAPISFSSPRDARAAAARLALEANISERFQRGFDEMMKKDQHGYIQVGDFTATEATMLGELAQPEQVGAGDEERDEDDDGGSTKELDALESLHKHVKEAFGSYKAWIDWAYEHAKQEEGKTARGPPSLGATLTIKIPMTEKHPIAPPPFVISTEPRYRTKYYARLACATSAFENGLMTVLDPYKKEREDARREKLEKKAKEAEAKRKEREAGRIYETPQAGTVKYEELASLPNPAAYLNVCAQQWTGNGSPLKFEYNIRAQDDSNIKHYGCTLTVFVNISLSRTYEIAPSPEYKNRAAAKEAAVRLALKERVLDLLTPAGFDPAAPPLTAAAASRLARAARGREIMEVEEEGQTSGATESVASDSGPRAVPPAKTKDAVSRLDDFIQEWVGTGCLPIYEMERDERTGLYGGSLCIPFASGSAPEDFGDPHSRFVPNWSRTMSFNAAFVSRTQAQQRFAQDALDEGIIEFMQANVPRYSKEAPPHDEECGCSRLDSSGTTLHKHGRSESDTEGGGGDDSRQYDADSENTTPETSAPPKKRAKLDLAEESEALVGKEGGSVARLRLGCRAILGDEAKVGPRYKVGGQDDAFGASVMIPLDVQAADWRTFGVPPEHETRELACEAAAFSALNAGILDLIESRVRPMARAAPPVVPPAEEKHSSSTKQDAGPPGITCPTAQVPKHGEELAAARRASYGGFGMATAYMLEEITKKLNDEQKAEQEREEAKREEARKKEELKRLGNPLLPGVPTTPEGLRSLFSGGPSTSEKTQTTYIDALKAYCDTHGLTFPRIFTVPLVADPSYSGPARCRVWLFLRGLKFELPRVRTSVAEERLAEKVLAHLRKLDEAAAAGAAKDGGTDEQR